MTTKDFHRTVPWGRADEAAAELVARARRDGYTVYLGEQHDQVSAGRVRVTVTMGRADQWAA